MALAPDPCPDEGGQPALEPLLEECRRGLERGDYGQVLRTLEPLVAAHPPATALGAEIQMLMVTAWMGQGNTARAIACCHQLKRSSNAQLRTQARELLAVLEAPALERPREWSITLPELTDAEVVEGRMRQMVSRRRSSKPPPPPPPPVGPTRANLGFALVVAALMLVAVLLGGCVQVRGELHFAGPGRLQLGYALAADTARPTPWQQQFGDYLASQGFHRLGGRNAAQQDAPQQYWRSTVLPADAALAHLGADLQQAARLGGLALPPPQLRFQERNFLVGVRQSLVMELDLTGLAGVGGVNLALDLDPVSLRAVQLASPLAAEPSGDGRHTGRHTLRWPLEPGVPNQLKLRCWRWSPLGLGAVAVALVLGLALALQTLRRAIAPPLPELPA